MKSASRNNRPSHALIGTLDDTGRMARWLLIVAALIVLIVAVGGITRLTESGLSIAEWKPVTGAIPPLTEAQWSAEFARYKQIPQYIDVNGPAGMTLAQYKGIYFWEWFHRLLGRVIGLAMIGPLLWFWARRTIPLGYRLRLVALTALIGLQGTIGWLMVHSGLTPDALDRVSHFWLGAHLVTALFTLGGMVWTALDLRALGKGGRPPARLTGFGAFALLALGFQIFMGAMVAGLRAGYVSGAGWFNWSAWPLMQGKLFPEGVDWSHGALHAAFDDPYLVNFIHRWWAWVVVAVLIAMGRRLRAARRRDVSIALHTAFGLQVLLGISTLWSGVWIPIAVAHQVCAALLVAATTWGAHTLGRRG